MSAKAQLIDRRRQLDQRCQYTSAHGRRCRMSRLNGHSSLCYHHRRQELKPEPDLKVAAELLGSIRDFKTAAAVNHVLGRLLAMLAANRIPARNAAVLAYICQLLLLTLPAVEREVTTAEGFFSWRDALRQALRNPKATRLAQAIVKRATEAITDPSPNAS